MKKLLTCYKHLQIFILGIYSGMPYLTYSNISIWFADFKIEIAIITVFATARVAYTLKPIWAPLVDNCRIPVLGRIGHRKSWMIICSSVIAGCLFLLSIANPQEDLYYILILTFIIYFASATFDIVFDAFRIETIADAEQSIAATNAVMGYRIGMLIAGSWPLFVADYFNWGIAFLMLFGLHLICLIFIVTIQESSIKREKLNLKSTDGWTKMIARPFTEFFKREYAVIILFAIIFYKLGDAMLGVVAQNFYIYIGFTKSEIGIISKTFGLIPTIVGAYFGGFLLYRLGNFKGLIICGIAQGITNVSFLWLNYMGAHNFALIITIVIENVANGMATAALIGYMSCLCNKQYSATQYALLSSGASFFNSTIIGFGGTLVELLGWNLYFLMTVFLAFPSVILLFYLNKKLNSSKNNYSKISKKGGSSTENTSSELA